LHSATISNNNLVDTKEFIEKKRQEIFRFHHRTGIPNAQRPSTMYKNENYYDWLTNANHVAFIELNGPVLGGIGKGCIRCYKQTEKGSGSPPPVHSMECPYNQFTFDAPIMDNGVNIINFYGNKAKKITEKKLNNSKKHTEKNVASVVSVGESYEEQKPAAIAVTTTTRTLRSATNSIGAVKPVSNVDGNYMGAVKPKAIAVTTTTRTLRSATNSVGAVSEGFNNDGLAPSTTFREGDDIILTLDFMQDKAEMLTCVDNFVDTQVLLASVQCLITAGKFAALGDSNVVQFKKDYHDINFGMWGNLVRGRRKVEKASEVKKLKNNIIQLLKTSRLIDVTKICWDEVQVTALFTDSKRHKKQDPHTDYQLANDSFTVDLAWTAHLPLNKVEGSYIYLWNGAGCGTAVHIPGGHCLLIRSDVVHSGGVPDGVGMEH
jgi:hypothetical protein